MGQTKMVLITGAGSGIGEACARLFAQDGYQLILTGRQIDKLKTVAKAIGEEKTILAAFDISKKDQVQKFIKEHQENLQHVDVLINNAGLAKGADPVHLSKEQDWEEMIDTNIKGLFYLTRQILPLMLAKNSGHIIQLGSVAGRWAYPGGAVYCATKHAVRAFSEGLRMDLLGKNIRITNIEPGMVNTNFSTVRFNSKEKADAVYQGMTPLSAADIAEAILWSVKRPSHVNIHEMVIYPTDQAHVTMVHRK